MTLRFSFIFCCIIFIMAAPNVQARDDLATYGESCNSTSRCNSRASLSCISGTCVCILPENMVFDGVKCNVLAGEKCSFTDIKMESGNRIKKLTEELSCIPNSVCQSDFCTCIPGFYESGNGTCLTKRGHGEECSSALECNESQRLLCEHKTKRCECDVTTTIFDINKETCLLLPGTPCQQDNEGEQDPCSKDSICQNKVCECIDPKTFANTSGQCEKKRECNQTCNIERHCSCDSRNIQFMCNAEGRCACNLSRPIYDTYSYGNYCASPAGSYCQNTYDQFCVSFSSCIDGKCTCDNGYFATSMGQCRPKQKFEGGCNSDIMCDDRKNLKCRKNGFCGCAKSWQVYDAVKDMCVGLIGASCKNAYEFRDDCVTNAGCIEIKKDNYECKCGMEFSKSSNGTCLSYHGYSCSDGWNKCNGDAGLICKQRVCSCKFEAWQTYDSYKGKCVSYIHGSCDDGIPCVENAHCSSENIGKICKCDVGYVAVKGKCYLSIGQPCDYKNNYMVHGPRGKKNAEGSPALLCDPAAPLKCIEGRCQCEAWEGYDDNSRICRGLVGSFCDSKYPGYCSPNSECFRMRSPWSGSGVCMCRPGYVVSTEKTCIEKKLVATFFESDEVLVEMSD